MQVPLPRNRISPAPEESLRQVVIFMIMMIMMIMIMMFIIMILATMITTTFALVLAESPPPKRLDYIITIMTTRTIFIFTCP